MRSRIPGSVAIGTWAPSKTMCSYTSSVTTRRSCFTQTAAIAASSSRVKTRPDGLPGELRTSEARPRAHRRLERLRRPDGNRAAARGTDARLRLRERDAGQVGVVEGLEDDRLVAGREERQEGGAQGLGGAGVDRDLRGRVVVDPVEALLVIRHRLLQRGQARHRGVLVVAGLDGRDRGLLDELGAVEVGVALAEVHRAVEAGERRHLGEDGRAEGGEAGRERRASHEPSSVPRPCPCHPEELHPRQRIPRDPSNRSPSE